MSKFFLANDLDNVYTKQNLLMGGDSDILLSKESESQLQNVVSYIKNFNYEINLIISSNMSIIDPLVHNLRMKFSKHKPKCIRTPLLNERKFGKLCGTYMPYNSDLFSHSRICSENGESVQQCKDRCMSFINLNIKSKIRIS